MNKPKDDRRVRKTKKALREGFITLMAEKNIQDISVRELTDLVDIHRGTFYLHYRDIYDLQEQLENEIIEEVDEILRKTLFQQKSLHPEPVLREILTYISENKEICKMLLSPGGNKTFIDKLSEIIKQKSVEVALERMNLDATTNELTYISDFLVSGYIAAIGRWLLHDIQESPEIMAKMLADLGKYGASYYESEIPANHSHIAQ